MSEAMAEVLRRLESMHAELQELRRELVRLRHETRLPESPYEQQVLPFAPPARQYVTLDQIAAIVRRQKRSLEKYRGRMPRPASAGGHGRPTLWAWADVRPWLEETFGLPLPDCFPAYAG